MNEYRISYNPYTKDYISGSQSHSIQLYNRGRQSQFNEYIRGIIHNDTLYLRVYYPYEDIDTLTRDKLYQASYTLLKDNEKDIIKAIKKQDNIIITGIKYNVTNDLLSSLKLCNI
jgi:hypothetical protein